MVSGVSGPTYGLAQRTGASDIFSVKLPRLGHERIRRQGLAGDRLGSQQARAHDQDANRLWTEAAAKPGVVKLREFAKVTERVRHGQEMRPNEPS
jgi:hypothetical protein